MRISSAMPFELYIFRHSFMLLGRALSSSVRYKSKRAYIKGQKFIDWKRVSVRGGAGGNGCVSFDKSRRTLRLHGGRPDGGEGGCGGGVVFVADSSVRSLNSLTTNYRGRDGEHGRSSYHAGKGGANVMIKVPLGTVIKDHNDGTVLADLVEVGSSFTAAQGGEGGAGNALFDPFKESRFDKELTLGSSGEERVIEVEMKTIADVGMVGFPNAGKSSLLRALSRATPKVAAYPFTTLKPHIGIVENDQGQQLAVADIPGLISGAHENRGLGHAFLRHIERCNALLFVVDIASSDPPPTDQLKSLKFELKMYEPRLAERVSVVLANKMDLLSVGEGERELERLKEEGKVGVAPVSALMMDPLKQGSLKGHWWTKERLCRELFKISHNSSMLQTHS